MALTGPAEGAPVVAPGDLAGCAQGAIDALAFLAGARWRGGGIDGAALLGERAAIMGLGRRGTISPGGACRLLPTSSGWLAINLPRDDDLASVPAWLGESVRGDPWDFVAERVACRVARPLVARARLLGLAAAEAVPPPRRARPWCRIEQCARPVPRSTGGDPLVVDLSSLWAGPLAASLLGFAGARVIKVESARRPDGARSGAPAFYDLLNAGKDSVAVDLRSPGDRARLRALIASSDIVVESARPRALAQLGIEPREMVASVPGLTWVGITGYGRTGRGANRIAFGDDAAVAAGLATATGIAGAAASPLFCADAIADPLTGLYAAVAALDSWRRGGGQIVDVALRAVVAAALTPDRGSRDAAVEVRRSGGADAEPAWDVVTDGRRQPVAPPRARPVSGVARALGADTDAVLRRLTA
jgi:CoA transferase family III